MPPPDGGGIVTISFAVVVEDDRRPLEALYRRGRSSARCRPPRHLVGHLLGEVALVERIGATVRDRLEDVPASSGCTNLSPFSSALPFDFERELHRGRHLRVLELREDFAKSCAVSESRTKPVARERDRGLDNPFQASLPNLACASARPATVPGMPAAFAPVSDSVGELAVLVEVHVARGLRGRHLAVVDRGLRAVVHADDHEAAAADVARRSGA